MKPSFMSAAAVWSWLFANGQAVVNVSPMIGRGVRRIDAERLGAIDRMKHLLDLWPAGQAQQAPAG